LKRIIVFILITAFVSGCVSKPLKPTSNKKYSKQRKVTSEKTPVLPTQKTQPKKITPIPTPEQKGKLEVAVVPKARLELPTRLNVKDGTTMIRIVGGRYLLPDSAPVTGPQMGTALTLQPRPLKTFFIDTTEITVARFKVFNPKYDETVFTEGESCPQCPAMGISWTAADNYCKWAEKRLPTEQEWEAAARGRTPHPLPWGTKHLPRHANLLGPEDGFSGPAPVGSFPLGTGVTGVVDMIGNVWEWVVTPAPLPAPKLTSTPNEEPAPPMEYHLLKGGGWRSPKKIAGISIRNAIPYENPMPTVGFRCARSGK